MLRLTPAVLRLTPAVLWTVMIAVLLAIPGSYVPDKAWGYDKIGHFGMFVGFGLLWAWGLADRVRRPFLWIALAGITYGIGSEIVQSVMPGERTGEMFDAVANVAGLATGLLLAARHQRRLRRGAIK